METLITINLIVGVVAICSFVIMILTSAMNIDDNDFFASTTAVMIYITLVCTGFTAGAFFSKVAYERITEPEPVVERDPFKFSDIIDVNITSVYRACNYMLDDTSAFTNKEVEFCNAYVIKFNNNREVAKDKSIQRGMKGIRKHLGVND
ncbi:hypothetical protein V5T82_14090 [Magnetovibrio sp. PR-2]|uniref:hypothetical protein n=1 Tax=Magnetovibrio sp. PR-2 TaxID=3120356 RepID=UPI002FCE089E